MREIRSPLDGILSPFAARPVFTPADLFASGEDGAWYDPSDLSTLFQDAAGTTPVTSDSDPVRLMLDKSGNGNHAVAPNDDARPRYKTAGGLHWLEFDGVDDVIGVNSPSVNITPTHDVMVGGRILSLSVGQNAAFFSYAELDSSAPNSTSSQVGLAAYNDGGTIRTRLRYPGIDTFNVGAILTLDIDKIMSMRKIAADDTRIRVDGVETVFSATTTAFTTPRGIRVGRHVSTGEYANIRIYQLLVIDRNVTSAELAVSESYLADKSGVTL